MCFATSRTQIMCVFSFNALFFLFKIFESFSDIEDMSKRTDLENLYTSRYNTIGRLEFFLISYQTFRINLESSFLQFRYDAFKKLSNFKLYIRVYIIEMFLSYQFIGIQHPLVEIIFMISS